MTTKEKHAIAKMLLVVRHARNWGRTADQLGMDAVEAEVALEQAVGTKEYKRFNKMILELAQD